MEIFGSVRGYQRKLVLIPYEEGEHVLILLGDGELDDAWYRASDGLLVNRYGHIIGRPENILHKRDRERRM